MRILAALSIALLAPVCQVTAQQNEIAFPTLRGPYLGQRPPGLQAELFAPTVVSTPFNEDGSPVFTPDGTEVFWRIAGSPFSAILHMKQAGGVWSRPEMARFSGEYQDACLSMSPDGKRLFFASKRLTVGTEPPARFSTWVVEKNRGGWSEPELLGFPVSNPEEYYTTISTTSDGTLIKHSTIPGGKGGYDLYACEYRNGQYQEMKSLPGEANTEFEERDPAVAPDGSYVVFSCGNRPDCLRGTDLYATFKKEDGAWTSAIRLGDGVNTEYVEKQPNISPDGRYLFFVSDRPLRPLYAQHSARQLTVDELKALYEFYHQPKWDATWGDVYWVDTGVIQALRPAAGSRQGSD